MRLKAYYFWICLLGMGFLVTSTGSAHAQLSLPPMTLEVKSIEGTVEYRNDTGDQWLTLKKGQSLAKGDRVKTAQDATATLTIPGVSLIQVKPDSLMEVGKMVRHKEERGILTTEKVTVNDIEMEELEGKIQNSLRKHQNVSTDYKLRTPNAVAGVRGTDFQCEVTDFGRTECSVLEGKIRFASRADPEKALTLNSGQRSGIDPDATQPGRARQLDEQTRSELRQFQKTAQQALRLPPVISDLSLNGTSFENQVKIKYESSAELTISGDASASEDEASLESIQAERNGQSTQVNGLSSWEINFTPEVPENGGQKKLTFELVAKDNLGSQSDPRTFEVILVNPGKQTTNLPKDYEEGNVSVKTTAVAGIPVGQMNFPYHLYRPDASEEGILVQGTVNSQSTVENVGYSLDGGKSWKLARGAQNWHFNLPTGSNWSHNPLVVAWTANGTIGEPVEIGSLNYRPVSYVTVMRETLDGFMSGFEQENVQAVGKHMHPDFLSKDPGNNGRRDGGDDGGGVEMNDKQAFLDQMREQMRTQWRSIRVFYSISEIFGSKSGGTLNPEFVEVNLKAWDSILKNYVNAAMKFSPPTKFARTSTGKYKIVKLEDFNPNFFPGYDNVTMHDTNGYNQGPTVPDDNTQGVRDNRFKTDESSANGWLIAGLATNNATWPGSPPRLYVNPSATGSVTQHSWCPCSNGPVEEGGIFDTGKNSFDKIDRIPRVTSPRYQNRVKLKEGNVYAANMKSSSFSTQITYLIQVTNLQDRNNDGVVDELVFRVVDTGGQPNRDFNGVNPFR